MSEAGALQLGGLETFVRCEHAAMATTFVFYLRAEDGSSATARAAADEAFRLIERLEDRLSFYREASDVSRINRAQEGDTVPVDEATLECLFIALEVAAASNGAFDPFAGGPALAAKRQPVPPHLQAHAAVDGPGVACLAVDPEGLRVSKLAGRRWLDLGAVGKGYALDAARQSLVEWGVSSGLLVAGGSSVLAFGPGPGADGAWPVQLSTGEGRRALALPAPFGLGASGEGLQPGHLIAADAKTRPNVKRAYVLAPSSALADALSTALWLVSPAQRVALAEPWPEVAFLVEPQDPALPAVATGVFAESAPAAPACLLVVPCWCESQRLPRFLPALCAAVTASGWPVEILPSDDGSPEAEAHATAVAVEKLRRQYPLLRPLTRLIPHGGKGAAIRHGWQQAAPGTPWLGFVDADGSVPAEDVARLLDLALRRPVADALIAPTRRHQDPSHPVSRRTRRAWIGSAFAHWSQWRLRHGADDPQCGCKLLPAAVVRSASLVENGYGLDLELLLLARRHSLTVLNPPISWRDTPASRLRWKDFFSMLQTIERLRISSRASTGASPASPPSTP